MTYITDIQELRKAERSPTSANTKKMDDHYRIKREMEAWELKNKVTVLESGISSAPKLTRERDRITWDLKNGERVIKDGDIK